MSEHEQPVNDEKSTGRSVLAKATRMTVPVIEHGGKPKPDQTAHHIQGIATRTLAGKVQMTKADHPAE